VINIMVALPAEARPLITHYKLQHKQNSAAFPLYRNADMALVVSGPGKVSAAAATAVLAGSRDTQQHAAWLNIGIAGHASLATGKGFIAHRITDSATGNSWYPPQTLDLSAPTDKLITVDHPENDYPENALYDMEASGFYPVACRFSTSELVQCYKIVSDNRECSTRTVTAKLCEQLVARNLESIDALVAALGKLAQEYSTWHTPHAALEQLAGQWHFTVSQQHQLAQLVRRWKALLPGQPLRFSQLDNQKKAAGVLHCLEKHLDALAADLTSDHLTPAEQQAGTDV
jgi:adenosylhomocysteine nucleosidase